jgi:2-polyprenyl-3-methyl-5-hydroxy-6-metoxy-1,4-benzoquinol methylase
MLPDFSTRSEMAELMDDPRCSEEFLLRTLQQFASINRLFSRYRTILKRWVLADMLKSSEKAYHLVDMGAGGCDIAVWLLHTAGKLGLNLRITACDLDPRIIDYAHATYGHIDGLTIRQMDLLAGGFDGPVDFVFANHFLHHLTNDNIIDLIRLWQPQVRHRMILSDLERNRFSYVGFSFFARLYCNSFARSDGLISIQRGFRAGALEALAREALGDGSCCVHRLAPGRLTLCIEGRGRKTPEPRNLCA